MAYYEVISEWLKQKCSEVSDVLFPRTCLHCRKLLTEQESYLCSDCLANLPLTYMQNNRRNQAEMRLADKATIEYAASYCWYVESSEFRTMIHQGKFGNRPEILYRLAYQAAQEWKQSELFAGIDMIIPVPLHKQRLRQRGYNQSEYIAHGIGDCLNIPVLNDGLQRLRNDNSQTMLANTSMRENNVAGAFELNPKYTNFENLTILIVDDVLTTGATIANCAKQFKPFKSARIRVFTLALSK